MSGRNFCGMLADWKAARRRSSPGCAADALDKAAL
jgi:hypothetical protein